MRNWRSLRRQWRRVRRRLESGYSSTVTFLMLVIPLLLVIDVIAAVTIARPAQINVSTAARECARMATTSLDETIGRHQGEMVAERTLQGAGYSSRNNIHIKIAAPGGWSRGAAVNCSISLNVPFGGFGLIGAMVHQPRLTVRGEAQASLEAWRSDWSGR